MVSFDMQTRRDGKEWDGTGWDRTGQNGEEAKMLSDGNKKEEEGDGEVIILCSTDVERVVLERKFIQNSSSETTHSTRFRHTKRGTERLVPLCSILSHVPNSTYGTKKNYMEQKKIIDVNPLLIPIQITLVFTGENL
ncbi:hypothetical protein DVH24_005058 [Malus domestica]|uniref:Uncharacterized protein n=1 Tax=Malus domestica TaxID=3750 RepID=A0A498IG93_MALDO|nr:hypothetical protein DVH24_005058 [Malus domestica]